ncbi:DUF6279 family lipoprotein [Polycyclovorans algicola]|uniref:DUF6279 family lipoprotein n=1 Tax=Polycyclovorans algicola TaxID=616992 RepID=UPI0004A70B33|nr:DUF6279 family lipoprotein [Polycyclovorans algicola]
MARRSTLVVCAALLLSACSLPNLVYNRADFFVVREVGKYLTLTDAQKDALGEAVTDWQVWHRAHALPQWQTDTQALATDLQAPLEAAEISAWGQRVERHLRVALDEMMVRLVPLIATLSDAQIAEFWASFDEQRAERRDDAPSDVDALAQQGIKSMRRWVGRPNDEQVTMIVDWADAQAGRWQPSEIERAAREDARRRAEIDALLAARTAPDALDRWRASLAEDDPPDRRAPEANAARVSLLAALSASLNARQRDHLVAELEGYADLFGKMAAGG